MAKTIMTISIDTDTYTNLKAKTGTRKMSETINTLLKNYLNINNTTTTEENKLSELIETKTKTIKNISAEVTKLKEDLTILKAQKQTEEKEEEELNDTFAKSLKRSGALEHL